MRAVQVKATGKWLIWDNHGAYGPYDTKAEAESDRLGMERFIRHGHKPGFLTTDKKGK